MLKYKCIIISILLMFSFVSSLNWNINGEEFHSFPDDSFITEFNKTNENIEVFLNNNGTVGLKGIKKVTDNTFPGFITFNGEKIPITFTDLEVFWPRKGYVPDSIAIPEGLKTLSSRFTRSCPRVIRTVTFPETLDVIGYKAFENMSLEKVILSESVVKIEKSAFSENKQLHKLYLGKVEYIGESAFGGCTSLKWLEIPSNTRLIGYGAFTNSPIFFLQLSPMGINPVIDFAYTFGSVDIPYVACASEFLNPGIRAIYQSDMPEVFENRAMIHLDGSPVPLYFSFEETGDREGVWEQSIDLWAYVDKPNADAGAESSLEYPLTLRMDTSSIPSDKHSRLRVFYNDREITDSIVNCSFTIDSGSIFNGSGYRSGAEPIYNRLKVILEQ